MNVIRKPIWKSSTLINIWVIQKDLICENLCPELIVPQVTIEKSSKYNKWTWPVMWSCRSLMVPNFCYVLCVHFWTSDKCCGRACNENYKAQHFFSIGHFAGGNTPTNCLAIFCLMCIHAFLIEMPSKKKNEFKKITLRFCFFMFYFSNAINFKIYSRNAIETQTYSDNNLKQQEMS